MKNFMLSLDDNTHTSLKIYSTQKKVSMNNAVINMIKDTVSSKSKKIQSSGYNKQKIGDHDTFFKDN